MREDSSAHVLYKTACDQCGSRDNPAAVVKTFKLCHTVHRRKPPIEFSDTDPPDWLLGIGFRWFWEEYVSTLQVGDHVETDFHKITRIE